jgi:SulP family sulfate permease
VEVGMIMAALLYIRRVSSTTTVSMVTSDYIESGRAHSLQDKRIPPYVAIFRIHGPLLFGVTDKLAAITDHLDCLPAIVIVRLRNMNAIDATGIKALEDIADRVRESGRTLLLCGAREQPAALMKAAAFHHHVGDRNICQNILQALERAEELHRSVAA